MSKSPTPDEILASPSTSHWLKDALKSALNRDCVDAASDAELLAFVLSERAQDIVASRWLKGQSPRNHSTR